MNEMEWMAMKLRTLQGQVDLLQKQMDEITAQMKQQLEKNGLDEMQAGPFRISWKLIRSHRFDTKRFQMEHADIYKLYSKPTEYRQFRVH